MNHRLISSVNSATEKTLPMQEKTRLYQAWYDDIMLKELHDLKDQQIAQNTNSNELSRSRKRIKLHAKFFKK